MTTAEQTSSMDEATETNGLSSPELNLAALKAFRFERILMESIMTGSVYLLGSIQDQPAIVHVTKTMLDSSKAVDIVNHGLDELQVYLVNQPYFSAHGLLARTADSVPDLKIAVTWPATEIHIKKYTEQKSVMVSETSEMYENIVVPYIESMPADRLGWVYQILGGLKEAERVIFRDEDPENGFIILPDLKWDGTNMSALYLTGIVQTRSIRTIRDLTTDHLPLLRRIQSESKNAVKEKYGVEGDEIKIFIHYQPSYYHFHVHITHIKNWGMAGMVVGKAHLLDDVISLLELSAPAPSKSLLSKMTMTYTLGEQHGLFPAISAAQSTLAATV